VVGIPDHNGAYHRLSASCGPPRSTFTLRDTGWVEATTRGQTRAWGEGEKSKVKGPRYETEPGAPS